MAEKSIALSTLKAAFKAYDESLDSLAFSGMAADLGGVVSVSQGGTGVSTLTTGSYLVGAGKNAVVTKTPAQVRTDIGAVAKTDLALYLPLTGGTLTGALNGTAAQFSSWVQAAGTLGFGNGAAGTQYVLSAKTPGRNGHIIFVGGGKKADGDANGTVVGLGAGGLTIVGGGEYASNRYNVGDLNDTAEQLYLGSDNHVYIETNGNTIGNRKTFEFTPGGHFIMPVGCGIEAGSLIDFHTAEQPEGADFMARIQAAETGAITLFPTDKGFASATSDPRAQWTFQQDMTLAVRRFDGSAWSSWSYYKFGNAGRLEVSGPFTMATKLALGTAANAHPIEVLDSNRVIIAQNRVGVTEDSKSYNYLVARQGTSDSGGIKQVSFGILCDSSGTATYRVSNPENFRSAIGLAVSAEETTIANVIKSTESAFKVNSVSYVTYDKIAMLYVRLTTNQKLSPNQFYWAFALVSGKRPVIGAFCGGAGVTGFIHPSGDVELETTISDELPAGTSFSVVATYILK